MPGFSSKPIIIDASGHLLGRLAAVVAKTLLQGNRVVILRTELINLSGNFYRNKLKFIAFLRKRCNVNPARGPFHHRTPGMIFWRAVRGMIPHKTKRGNAALRRMRVYEGCPPPYDRKKRMVVPAAMRIMCLRPERKYCYLGRLAHEVGWKYQHVVKTLEMKRKMRDSLKKKKRVLNRKLCREAEGKVAKQVEGLNKVLKAYGHKMK